MKRTILQLGTATLVLGGFVVLTLKGADTNSYVAMVAPILGAVFVINHLDHRSDKQDEKLEQQDQLLGEIHHNTNGVLEERIKRAVQKALDERKRE